MLGLDHARPYRNGPATGSARDANPVILGESMPCQHLFMVVHARYDVEGSSPPDELLACAPAGTALDHRSKLIIQPRSMVWRMSKSDNCISLRLRNQGFLSDSIRLSHHFQVQPQEKRANQFLVVVCSLVAQVDPDHPDPTSVRRCPTTTLPSWNQTI